MTAIETTAAIAPESKLAAIDMTATLFRAPFRELLARDRKTVLDGEIAEPDFWAAVCVSGARLIDDLRDFTDASTLLRLDEPSEV